MGKGLIDDFSCGVIPYRVVEGRREFLLVQHQAGHWAFPKGHPEEDEDYIQTARRELKEETGLRRVTLDEGRPFHESYRFTKRSGKEVRKRVIYFLGQVLADQALHIQFEEVSDYAWGEAQQTRERLTFDEGKALFDEVLAYLNA